MISNKLKAPYFAILFLVPVMSSGQSLSGVKAVLEDDTLHLQNKQVSFTYYWNEGNLVLTSARDNNTGVELNFPANKHPNLVLPGEHAAASGAQLRVIEKRAFPNEHLHKEVTIDYELGELLVKHVIKIYPDAPAISHTFFLKGKARAPSWSHGGAATLGMIESGQLDSEQSEDRIGCMPLDQKHWVTTIVTFTEATDHHDNLVFEKKILPYRKKENHQGNIVLATHPSKTIGFFLIKESPIGFSQQYYNGYDFQIDEKQVTIHGIGVSPGDLSNEWIQGYGYAIGLSGSSKFALQKSLLTYQKQLRKYIPERDGMVLANTWGDRSKDSRMNEAFILEEIEQAAKIGISHLQLDDGWQRGLSRNSASKAGQKWDDWSAEDWTPHPERFPNGFRNIVNSARNKKVQICLWFNPSKANSYQLWERDAEILIDYYHRYGIKVFKIDGISFDDKQSEVNLRKLFSKVMNATHGEVTFNMDVTAGHRVGYHFFNEFGNIFLENRYTDWGNYYPHRTLRNLWKLSAYVPTERLQIEFLNNSRNHSKYDENDLLAPGKVPITYSSAITLVAQPLAWMEVSNLAHTDGLQDQFAAYKKVANVLHTHVILPVGDEPSGFSWTGFVAYSDERPTYFMPFRELNNAKQAEFRIHGMRPETDIERVLGENISIIRVPDHNGIIRAHASQPFSYGLFSLH